MKIHQSFAALLLAGLLTSSTLAPIHANIFVKWESFKLMPGMGDLYHPVSTKNPEAQKFFNQGLTYIYAFNHDAAYMSFRKASSLDPNLAMAYWGMALSLGQNINSDITPERAKNAYEYIQKASELAPNATQNEQDYIHALAQRYSNDPNADRIKLRDDYKAAMEQVVKTYPEDLDAATLYGESMMNIHPWALWDNNGILAEGTKEILDGLESVLKRDPLHLGANHYYIHAIEGSRYPERALMSAQRLETLLPASGHILHMPSHIYYLVGDFSSAVRVNLAGLAADRKYVEMYGLDDTYPVHYMSHNMYFLTRAYIMLGQYNDAYKSAIELREFYLPHTDEMPDLEYYLLAPMQVLLSAHRWNEVLKVEKPEAEMKSSVAYWHFARVMAYAGKGELDNAKKEYSNFRAAKAEITDQMTLGYNKAGSVLETGDLLLQANLARLNKQDDRAVQLLKEAISRQDALSYNEPPDWYYSIRQTLGGYLIHLQNYAEAEEVFREDLRRHPRVGRSLYGLHLTLQAQHKNSDDFWVQRELDAAWKFADAPLAPSDLNF